MPLMRFLLHINWWCDVISLSVSHVRVTLSETVSSVSTKPEPSVSASSSTDHEVSLGEYLLGVCGVGCWGSDLWVGRMMWKRFAGGGIMSEQIVGR